MEWNEVVNYLSSRLQGHSLLLGDVQDLAKRLQVTALGPKKFYDGNSVESVFREVLNSYYYYKSHGQNGHAIESMMDEMSRIKKFERLSAELKALYLTNLRIKQQIHITPFKKYEPDQVLSKKSTMPLNSDGSSEISLLRNEIAELRQKINESTNGCNRVPSSPRPPMRRKPSRTPEKTSEKSPSVDANRLDQISKILLDHDVCISDQKKTLAKMTKLCFGALSAVEKIENKISRNEFRNGNTEAESNMISLWENSHKQLKKDIIETKTELRSMVEKVKQGSNSRSSDVSNSSDIVSQLETQTNLLSNKMYTTDQNLEGMQIQLLNIQEQLESYSLELKSSQSKTHETELKLKSSHEQNKEDIVKLELSLGRLTSNDIPTLVTQIKDCESKLGKRVSNAEHVVRIDALRKEFSKKYELLKSDVLKEFKNCEDSYSDQIKLLREDTNNSIKNFKGAIDKSKLDSFVDTTQRENKDILVKMDKLVDKDAQHHANLLALNEKSSALEKEVKNMSEIMSQKLSELNSLKKQVEDQKRQLAKNNIDELKIELSNAIEEIEDRKSSEGQLTNDIQELKLKLSEESTKSNLALTKLEENLDNTLQRQEKIENEISSVKTELGDKVKSNVETSSQLLIKEVQACKSELNSTKNEIVNLENDIMKRLEDEKLQLSSYVEPLDNEMKTVKHEITSCQEDVAKCNVKLDKFNKDCSLSILRIKDGSAALEKKLTSDFENSIESVSQNLTKLIDDLKESTTVEINEQKKEIQEVERRSQASKNEMDQNYKCIFVPKEDLQDVKSTLCDDVTSLSEKFSVIKTDLDDFRLSEKSKYTLLDKKLKDFFVFSEEINATVYNIEEELKDLRLDVTVESKSMTDMKSQLNDYVNSIDQLNTLAKKVETCCEKGAELQSSIGHITDNVKKINDDFIQFKSFMRSSSKDLKTYEKQSNSEILNVKRKIDDLVTSRKLQEQLLQDVERIDKKLEGFVNSITQKMDNSTSSLEDDLEKTREQLSVSETSIEKLDKRIDTILENEISSRETIEPLISDMKNTVESNLSHVISNVMENQRIIAGIMELIGSVNDDGEKGCA